MNSVPPLLDINVLSQTKVTTREELLKELPPSLKVQHFVYKSRMTIIDILTGKDSRKILAVGPCSVHVADEDIDYTHKLAQLAAQVQDRFFIIKRTFFEKPRTDEGWQGLIVDPHLDESFDFENGLRIAWKLLIDTNDLEMPVFTELLDPVIPQYISGLITKAAIGARTIQAMTHRRMASGLSMPFAVKNGTDGSHKAALDAIMAGKRKNCFLGPNIRGELSLTRTAGNKYGCLILRGGESMTNFDETSVLAIAEQCARRSEDIRIMVDCSHGNSGKKCVNQSVAFTSVIEQIARRKSPVIGLSLESNHFPGRQDIVPGQPLKYGTSITDECIGWEETEELILWAYHKLA
jgi:3-deoxy-7-phosphoheptulonate synthase